MAILNFKTEGDLWRLEVHVSWDPDFHFFLCAFQSCCYLPEENLTHIKTTFISSSEIQLASNSYKPNGKEMHRQYSLVTFQLLTSQVLWLPPSLQKGSQETALQAGARIHAGTTHSSGGQGFCP